MLNKQKQAFHLGGESVPPGTTKHIKLPVGVFRNNAQVNLGAVVVHGRHLGPTLLVTACIHGDEINGAEIIRRLLRNKSIQRLRGTLIAVPIVNVPAFLSRSRYLPDRRDLNRLFPGSATGSLGSRLANVVTTELLDKADYVIDLHTGAINRPNLPQLRVTAGDAQALELSATFGAAVTIVSPERESSFRSLCYQLGKPMLLFEGGEALRLDSQSIRFGHKGIIATMRALNMLPQKTSKSAAHRSKQALRCTKSYWIRAEIGGIFVPLVALGTTVETNTPLGFIADPFGSTETPVLAGAQGILIGRSNEGLADEGDALFHIATTDDLENARQQLIHSSQSYYDEREVLEDHPIPYHPFTEED